MKTSIEHQDTAQGSPAGRGAKLGLLVLAVAAVSAHAAPAPAAPVAAAGKPAAPIIACRAAPTQRESLRIPLGQSATFAIDDVIGARSVGNPGVVQTIQVSPKQLYLVGTRIGSTNMMVQGRGGACSAVNVVVDADPTGLRQAIAELLPDEPGIRVGAAADALVLSGQVSDGVQAQRAVELAQRFVHSADTPVSNSPDTDKKSGAAADGAQTQARVINLLTVAAPQQVMLEVKVAEVSKTLIDQLGLSVNFAGSHWAGSIGSMLKTGEFGNSFKLDAQRSDQPIKILAEPNLMAISGQQASFMAGGKVFIPVPQSISAGGASVLLQEETFGVKLNFMPTVLRGGVINLQVTPEVSQLADSGTSFSYGIDRVHSTPVIDTRSASTTVQLRDGESFAIGGLMRNDVRGKVDALPGLGELPILGALFRSTNYRTDKTELVFVVTPHLVKPTQGPLPLPTDSFGKAETADVFGTINMEGRPAAPAAAQPSAATAPAPDAPAAEVPAATPAPDAPVDGPAAGNTGPAGEAAQAPQAPPQ